MSNLNPLYLLEANIVPVGGSSGGSYKTTTATPKVIPGTGWAGRGSVPPRTTVNVNWKKVGDSAKTFAGNRVKNAAYNAGWLYGKGSKFMRNTGMPWLKNKAAPTIGGAMKKAGAAAPGVAKGMGRLARGGLKVGGGVLGAAAGATAMAGLGAVGAVKGTLGVANSAVNIGSKAVNAVTGGFNNIAQGAGALLHGAA